jgi:uncharacterized protein YutE (UPF0331/DUF86 family)
MTLNPDLVRTRCQEIEDSLARLDKIRSGLSRDQFLNDRDAQDIASYRLLVAIEAALALCYHVTAKRLRKVPEEYAECFKILADGGIISGELSLQLQKTARFRNMLVHMYWKVDYGAVFDMLNASLDDLRLFSREIIKMV